MTPRAYIFYGLNAVRFLSIVALILVFSSGILVMVNNIKAVNAFQANKSAGNATDTSDVDTMLNCDYIEGSTVPNQPAGVFWAVVASLLVIFQTVILFLSEVGWPLSFFDHYFPVLGSNFGLGALGIFQCLIGAQILSHHVDEFTLVAAFFLFSIGSLNMLLGLIFRESAKQKRSISAWRSDSKDVLPTSVDNRPVFVNASPAYVRDMFTGSSSEKPRPAEDFPGDTWRSADSGLDKASLGFGRQGEKAAGLRGFILQKPEEALPRYASPSPTPMAAASVGSKLSRSKTTRTSISSFASPGVFRKSLRAAPPPASESDGGDDEDDMYADDDAERNGNRTPPPVFRSSPTAL